MSSVKSTNVTTAQLRILALEAAAKAYSPYSQVKVGAAVVTEDGAIFTGCNIENASYGATVCAERVAIWQAVSQGHKKIEQLYVYSRDGWPPCGLCRQVMVEFGNPTMEITFGNQQGGEQMMELAELIPQAFSSEHLTNKS
ncbi:MAG: cytidine deaminase [Bdellovibrionales bacterium]|jgi:cytidine deaminase|nr:cytidine deaminase [Bdellovibrionales bacterium]MBT3525422.1 cytidine deaminase [Bdellovibrionales bacterium]MBT7766255.1 cytidine deaminase [Bdellovibrionales bacterium]